MRTTVLTLLAIVASLPVIPVARAGDSMSTAARAGIDALVTVLAGDGTAAPGPQCDRAGSTPRMRFEHTAAAGIARADIREPMTADDLLHRQHHQPIVAVRILQLVEAGKLSLDTTSHRRASCPRTRCPVAGIRGAQLRRTNHVRQLLQHRTGLRDMLLDDRQHLSDDFESGTAPGSLGGIWSSQLARYVECRRATRDLLDRGNSRTVSRSSLGRLEWRRHGSAIRRTAKPG